MRIEEDIQIVKDFVAAMGSTNRQYLLAMVNEDFEWIIPGEDWPLAGKTGLVWGRPMADGKARGRPRSVLTPTSRNSRGQSMRCCDG